MCNDVYGMSYVVEYFRIRAAELKNGSISESSEPKSFALKFSLKGEI